MTDTWENIYYVLRMIRFVWNQQQVSGGWVEKKKPNKNKKVILPYNWTYFT